VTIYYVDSTTGSDSDDGSTWALAKATFGAAVTLATSDGDFIYVAHNHSESLSADTTYTFAANVRVLCVNSGTGALATTGTIDAQPTSYIISLGGAKNVYVYGLIFKVSGTSNSKYTAVSTSDGSHFELEQCTFNFPCTGVVYAAFGVNTINTYAMLKSCTFIFNSSGQFILSRGLTDFVDCSFCETGALPTTKLISMGFGASAFFTGCTMSKITSTLVGNNVDGPAITVFSNCKFGSGVTIKYAAVTVLNKGNQNVYAFNCDAGDNHYTMYHGDAFGETIVSTSVYLNDGATYDGSNNHRCSWKITTTANCNYFYPYVSPWLDRYHSNNIAITPYLEILRSGSSTAYQNDEVWSEWSYQGSDNSTKAVIDGTDRMTPLGTPADQTTSSKPLTDWAGRDSSNNWAGRLSPLSPITPLEIGYIRARICVGEPSVTVYADPKIRGVI
jgi:hypothetical protein